MHTKIDVLKEVYAVSTDPKINRELGEKIKAVRKARGYTREALAEQIDVSSRFLADIEAGKVGASLITLKRVCQTLGISADYLLGLAGEQRDDSPSAEAAERIKQLNPKYAPHLNEIIKAFCEAVKE